MPRASGVAKNNNLDRTPPVVEIGRPRLRGLIKRRMRLSAGLTMARHAATRCTTPPGVVQPYILDDTPFRSWVVDRLLLLL